MAELIAKFLLAYLLGGVMGGDVMRRLAGGSDLRASGSGNVGATNALRTRGAKFALGVLAIDIGKGVLAALVLPGLPWPLPGAAADPAMLPYLCGVGAALGHCYPVFQKFKGGKGVATLAGVFIALLPNAAPWLIAAFALVVMLSGYVSLASISAGVVALFYVACFGDGALSLKGAFTAAMLALILFKHRQNIVRLFQGRESRFEKARVLGRLFDGKRRS
ncbi:MAG: glycerol-3-phosphate 1-O-acyltransferase PlsY [Gammaproteobacteria bacterium]|uniref:glycerol-3-phosphate 1-O-acyltransferase PlsY n=1 Tax=Nevskia sp. TaxID=1929292 RepID=UPI0040358811|nr:glycerol-3-phosphate 1-O-acyltransferase PlsY [Gammaproteobacteria bacterium]